MLFKNLEVHACFDTIRHQGRMTAVGQMLQELRRTVKLEFHRT